MEPWKSATLQSKHHHIAVYPADGKPWLKAGLSAGRVKADMWKQTTRLVIDTRQDAALRLYLIKSV
ncbi:hypothetical protein ACIRG5_38860 [Lentzea sp. NPDC102401]|uniref:hypothetical protein n=1 Tax=Lentzea sp. NPDC102401 TaxID=3364128 RepID=UPI0038162CAE